MILVMRGGHACEPDEEDIAAIKKWLKKTPSERKQVEEKAQQIERERKEIMKHGQRCRK